MTSDDVELQRLDTQSHDWYRQNVQTGGEDKIPPIKNHRSSSDSTNLVAVNTSFDAHDADSPRAARASSPDPSPDRVTSYQGYPEENKETKLDTSRDDVRADPDPASKRQRNRFPRLSVNNRHSTIRLKDGLPSTNQLLSPLKSPISLGQETSDQALSPPTRYHGYPLHRSFFAKNNRNSREDNTVPTQFSIAGPSRIVEQEMSTSSRSVSSKKPRTTVTVIPKTDSMNDLELPPGTVEQWPYQRQHIDVLREPRSALSTLKRNVRDLCRKVYNHINRLSEIPPSVDGRRIEINMRRSSPLVDERTGRLYVNNAIRSNKYTPWTFLPRQLVAQFSKLANFYFLCISILQLIPGLSTTGTYTTILPLLFFVGLSIAKEGYEDLRRHRLDKAENSSIATVLNVNQSAFSSASVCEDDLTAGRMTLPWHAIQWQDVQVGDIVRLQRDEAIPADLVVMHVQGPSNIAFVETMALDGETNLKSKAALPLFKTHCASINDLVQCSGQVVVEDPNLDLYSFHGKLTLHGETLPLTNNEVLYRGSILRNTPEVIGVVIYSGEESKIRMNATKNPRIKAPALQAAVNRVVVLIAIFVLALAIWNTAAYQIWKPIEKKSWYLANASVPFFPILVSFIILFNT